MKKRTILHRGININMVTSPIRHIVRFLFVENIKMNIKIKKRLYLLTKNKNTYVYNWQTFLNEQAAGRRRSPVIHGGILRDRRMRNFANTNTKLNYHPVLQKLLIYR